MMNRNQAPQMLLKLRQGSSAQFCLPAILCFLLCLGATRPATAQHSTIKSISQDFDAHRKKSLQEKLFLHIDRPVYACGETIWFKVYLVDGTLHQPLDVSKVAYVEVLDEQQKPVLQAKVGLREGAGNGSFILPATLATGTYTVRAYTNWMKNFSPDFYFEQPVSIINTFRQLEAPAAPAAPGYAIQFFPEGGHLVAGVAGKVAFKAVDQSTGKGVSFKGELHDQHGTKIAEFAPHKYGIGHFRFTPAKGTTYTATLTLADGRKLTEKLPAAQEQGYTLQLEETDTDRVKLTVQQVGLPGEQVYLLGHARQVIAVAEAATLVGGTAVFVVDKNTLPDGITHFTVFNAGRQPVSERLYFKQPTQALQLRLAADRDIYSTRAKVTLDLQAEARGASSANLSLAVYRLDSLQKGMAGSIESYLWLTSDLKGTIENPEDYFSGTADPVALDNLMLTHGWSRFRWKDILGREPAKPEYLPEYNGHQIRGRVTHRVTGAPAPGVVTYLASPGNYIRLYNATSNAKGLVSFEVRNFFGERDIVVQSNFARDSSYHFEIFNPFSDKYSARKPHSLPLSGQLEQDLTLRHVQTQVQHAYLGNRANGIQTTARDSSAFYGQPDERYFLDDYKRFRVMEEVMREYVPGVMVRRQSGKFRFMVINRPYKSVFQNNPMVLLDGVPVFDIDRIMAFDPLKVQRLDVVASRFFSGPLVYDGVVSYATYQGDLAGFELDPKSLLQAYEGLQQQREFYAPTYETLEQKQSRLADLRNLLHWEPELVLEVGKEEKAHFYTSDQEGVYVVVVQGITENGLPGSKVLTFKVNQPLVRR